MRISTYYLETKRDLGIAPQLDMLLSLWSDKRFLSGSRYGFWTRWSLCCVTPRLFQKTLHRSCEDVNISGMSGSGENLRASSWKLMATKGYGACSTLNFYFPNESVVVHQCLHTTRTRLRRLASVTVNNFFTTACVHLVRSVYSTRRSEWISKRLTRAADEAGICGSGGSNEDRGRLTVES